MSGHDQPGAAPTETELRFVSDVLPEDDGLDALSLAGMRLTERGSKRLHSDVYFDTDRLALRAHGGNLRIRTGALGERWVTLKVKTPGGHQGALFVREEYEVRLEPGERAEQSTPWQRAGKLVRGTFRPVLQITTLRSEHRLGDGHGNEVVLAEDTVTYPDGSVERRLEVEMRSGTPQLLRLVEKDLRRQVKGLRAARRGKRSQAIRRLPQLFGS
ncbi:MAG TPA: CYTH domain-containing protein [Gaiellales bacterium]